MNNKLNLDNIRDAKERQGQNTKSSRYEQKEKAR